MTCTVQQSQRSLWTVCSDNFSNDISIVLCLCDGIWYVLCTMLLSVGARKSKIWHCSRNARSSNGNSGASSSWKWKTNATWQADWRCCRGMCVCVLHVDVSFTVNSYILFLTCTFLAVFSSVQFSSIHSLTHGSERLEGCWKRWIFNPRLKCPLQMKVERIIIIILWAGIHPTLDPYAEAFIAGPLR